MIILIYDAKEELQKNGLSLSKDLPLHELLYADDTLLMDICGQNLQAFMDVVVRKGAAYGLQMNWKKVEVLPINCEATLTDSTGNILKSKTSI